ncbi:MAG: hypothetical protein RIT51_82 [Actinomycetota bacterium]|jgi:hypothetical protein
MSEGKEKNINIASGSAGGLYFMGFVGAAIYYVSNATDFWVGVLGVIKSLVWPAFLVYEALTALGA